MDRTSQRTKEAGRFAWTLRTALDAVPVARRAFEAWMRDHAVPADDAHDLAVVLSELATNAANGAAPGTDAQIDAWLDRGALHLEVGNHVDAARTDVRRWDLDDQLRGGGRGLLIVRAYTDSMEIDSAADQVWVRCRRVLGAAS